MAAEWAVHGVQANAQGDLARQTVVVTVMLGVVLLTFFALLAATQVQSVENQASLMRKRDAPARIA